MEMLKPQKIMSDININLDLNAKKDTVLADPDKLKQLLLNIIMNAIDAMDTEQTACINDDKKLSIKTSMLSGTDLDMSKKGDKIHIECIDNGQGISPEKLDRIFDPFFTTKEPGKGTGLGLSVSLRIVEDIGGKIKIESEKGKGTTVTITLPLYET
jgi:signal transduction histidine kinase